MHKLWEFTHRKSNIKSSKRNILKTANNSPIFYRIREGSTSTKLFEDVASGVVTSLTYEMWVQAKRSLKYQCLERNNPWRWCVTSTSRK